MIIIDKSRHVYKMDKLNKPVVEVEPNSIIAFNTHDCFKGQLQSNDDLVEGIDFTKVNPATGPVFIKGAEPGDAIFVEILSIDVDEKAITVAVPNLGLLGDKVSTSQTEIVNIQHGLAYYGEKTFAIEPMIGVIGTAPAGDGVACGIPGAHGGNMDCKDIKAGSSIFLPVHVTGGLLALGDVHALQGDGEVCGTGFECAAEVIVRVSIAKNRGRKVPFIVTQDEIMAVGYGDTLEEACKLATDELISWIRIHELYSFNQAYMLLSAKMDLRICQLVNPKITVRAVIKKKDIF